MCYKKGIKNPFIKIIFIFSLQIILKLIKNKTKESIIIVVLLLLLLHTFNYFRLYAHITFGIIIYMEEDAYNSLI